MSEAVSLRGVGVQYANHGGSVAGIDLTIGAGTVTVLTGPSGSGKTTVLRAINGLVPDFFKAEMAGGIELAGTDASTLPAWRRSHLVGSVFQDPRSQFFSDEVAGEIAFGCENRGMSHDEIVAAVHRQAEDLGLADVLEAPLEALSYGIRQRVAIAAAAASGPSIYVFDEPSANLDALSTGLLHGAIRDLRDAGCTIIISEHRLSYLMDLADEIICMENGRIIRRLRPVELLALPEETIVELGLRTPDLKGVRPTAERSRRSVDYASSDRRFAARDVCKRFGRKVVLDGVRLECSPGEIVCIVGPNGCGKSTLARELAGLERPDSGEFRFDGRPVRAAGRRREVWYIGQDLDSQLFGESVIAEMTVGFEHPEQREPRAREILEELGLTEFVHRHPATLSGGQRQRLLLGVAMMHDARVIILDEPTSGLDGRSMRAMSATLHRLAEGDRSLLVITHDAEFAAATCTRIIRLGDGRVVHDAPFTSAEQVALTGW